MQRAFAVLTALALAVPAAAAAQDGVGIKAGLAYGNPSQSGIAPNTSLSGYNGWTAGLSLNLIGGGSPLGVQVEGLYARRGVNDGSTTDRRNFVDVPALLMLKLPLPAIEPYVYAGPQASWQLSCETTATACSGNSRWSYAGDVGAGVRLGSQSAITIEGRYMYGLTDFRWGTVSSSSSYRTRQFVILAGIGF